MRITLTRPLAGYAKGTTIERDTKVAQHLIAHGAATKAEQPKPPTKTTKTRKTAGSNAKATGKPAGQSVAKNETAGQRGGEGPPRAGASTAG